MQSGSKVRAEDTRDFADQDRLVAVWIHEFLHSALMSGLVSLDCNKLGTENLSLLREISTNAPYEKVVHRAIKSSQANASIMIGPAFFAADDVYEGTTHAIEVLLDLKTKVAQASNGLNLHLTINALITSWRSVCGLYLNAFRVFDQAGLLSDEHVLVFGTERVTRAKIAQVLRNAVSGKTTEDAGISVAQIDGKPWLPRRRWDRVAMNKSCLISSRGITLQAKLRNISLGGALIQDIDGLARGAPLSIIIDRDRHIPGFVVWVAERKAGIRFQEPLLPTDPLIESDAN
jgi:PilZ domain